MSRRDMGHFQDWPVKMSMGNPPLSACIWQLGAWTTKKSCSKSSRAPANQIQKCAWSSAQQHQYLCWLKCMQRKYTHLYHQATEMWVGRLRGGVVTAVSLLWLPEPRGRVGDAHAQPAQPGSWSDHLSLELRLCLLFRSRAGRDGRNTLSS